MLFVQTIDGEKAGRRTEKLADRGEENQEDFDPAGDAAEIEFETDRETMPEDENHQENGEVDFDTFEIGIGTTQVAFQTEITKDAQNDHSHDSENDENSEHRIHAGEGKPRPVNDLEDQLISEQDDR